MAQLWVKNRTIFKVQGDTSLEPPLSGQHSYITPNDRFFVCNAGATPRIDPSTYRLIIDGDAVNQRLELSYQELRTMDQVTVPAFIECAGNQRRLFEDVLDEKLDKRPYMTETLWGLGGVGMADWRGVRLKDVLRRAGIKEQAVHVCPIGMDKDVDAAGVQCPMPVGKALDPNTLLALEMNGEPLPPDHGFPVRVLVPGWVGTYSIKWVERLTVSSRFRWVFRNTERYILMGDEWPEEAYAPAKGAPITEQTLKSSLALEWPARLTAGEQTVWGFARSPDAEMDRVEWSSDGGHTWQLADLVPPNLRFAWVRFRFSWNARPGKHALMTRATDVAGRIQPSHVPFNTGGYLFNMVHPHPVVVD